METIVKVMKRLSVLSLRVSRAEYPTGHHFEPQNGKIFNTFGFIESGEAVFKTPTDSLRAGPGDLVFLPSGLKYFSIWSTEDRIAFYSIHFRTEITDSPFWPTMSLQRIDSLSEGRCAEKVKKIYELCGSPSAEDQLEGYSCFYSLAAEAVKDMTFRPERELPEAINRAVAFIDANYRTIGAVSEIADACFLSESRLYHLFRDHLNTTPVTYLNRIKILQATELMNGSDMSLEQIATSLNFNSEYCFRKTFKRFTGTLPSEFRKTRK
ncbi:MAG: helix-turn-helix domain-containing protein [Clostridia bacterium]|nr:helix-turn-helix domain-containing protein [Clostridia bacterium]